MPSSRSALPLRVIYEGWTTFGVATLIQPDGTPVDRCLERRGDAAVVRKANRSPSRRSPWPTPPSGRPPATPAT